MLSRKTSLQRYAAIAGATTASAVVGWAEADIIVNSSNVGVTIGYGGSSATADNSFFLGGGGFRLAVRNPSVPNGTDANYAGVVAVWIGAGTGQFAAYGSGVNQADLVSYGGSAATGATYQNFVDVNNGRRVNPGGTGGTFSNFNNDGNSSFSGTSKYLMFNFNNGGTKYGWIEITGMTGGTNGSYGGGYGLTLGRWAYDDSGAAITAGQTSNTPAVPGPAGLAALALGAAGVRRNRGR